MMGPRLFGPRARYLGPALALFGLAVAACEPETVDLAVSLRTDFDPGIEFGGVEVEIDATRPQETIGDPSLPWTDQTPVGFFSGIEPESGRSLWVRLRRPGGTELAAERVLVDNAESRAIVVVISRDCSGMVCDADQRCLGARCVSDGCLTGTEAACPAAACESDEECTGSSECAVDRCVEGICLSLDAGACGTGAYCERETGCRIRPVEGGIEDLRLLSPSLGERTGSLHAEGSLTPTLRWSPIEGAVRYEVQLESACGPSPDSCAFTDPFVSDEVSVPHWTPSTPLPVDADPPVGRRYFWRVRPCTTSECLSWSPISYFEAGRVREDYNGDGYADLAVTTTFQDPMVWVEARLGGPGGLADTPQFALDPMMPPVVTSPHGLSIAGSNDLNADGFCDLVVGYDTDSIRRLLSGALWVHYGGPSGLDPVREYVADPRLVYRGGFGHTVSTRSDTNADGYADAIVSAFRSESASLFDQIYLMRGGPSGLMAESVGYGATEFGRSQFQSTEEFGAMLRAVDHDRDRNFVLLGIESQSGIASLSLDEESPLLVRLSNEVDSFSLVDIDADGFEDLIVANGDIYLGAPEGWRSPTVAFEPADLVVTGRDVPRGPLVVVVRSRAIEVLRPCDDELLCSTATYEAPFDVVDVALPDIDGDGAAEVWVSGALEGAVELTGEGIIGGEWTSRAGHFAWEAP